MNALTRRFALSAAMSGLIGLGLAGLGVAFLYDLFTNPDAPTFAWPAVALLLCGPGTLYLLVALGLCYRNRAAIHFGIVMAVLTGPSASACS